MYRVYLVDDRPLPRAALRALLSTLDSITVAGEAGTLTELAAQPDGCAASAVVADYAVLAADEAPPSHLAPRLLLMNVPHLPPATSSDAAAGWLDRNASVADLVVAIATLDGGGRHVAAALDARTAGSDDGSEVRPGHGIRALSRREYEVMCALAAGRTNREIASDLGISVKTIDTHRGHVLKKLGLRNNSDITRFAIRDGHMRA
jgi:DNA-binding NarL/FixJ family response regulator